MNYRAAFVTFLAIAAPMGGGMATDAPTPSFDTIIRGGTVIDGSGRPAYKADVAIDGDHIAMIGDLSGARAAIVIDATGMTVAPGFINIHSHAQEKAVASARNMLTQGVTTEITNADGYGAIDISTQLAAFARDGLAENIGVYMGFNTTWQEVMGSADTRPTPEQIRAMQTLIDRNMAMGAWGVSAGLDYKPGYYAKADEVAKVVSVARKWRTNFPNHDRLRPEENFSSYKGVGETIAIAEKSGLMPVITHMKSQGLEQGNAPAILKMMDAASARGAYTTADVYPYLAGQTGLGSLIIPGWAADGGREAMLRRFADPATRARIVNEAETAMTARFGGWDGIQIIDINKTLPQVMAERGVRAGEAVIQLLEERERGAVLRFGAESDLIAFLRYPTAAIACDCGAASSGVHPRQWGTFPRVLGYYVRETRVLTLEDAIRKMTALPATMIGMVDRGYLAAGMKADVVVFDQARVIDRATYEHPSVESEGIRDVFVNGTLALRDGAPTGLKGGQIVLRTRHMPSRPMTPSADRKITASAANSRFAVSASAVQPGNAGFASGTVAITDRASRQRWTAVRLGVLQTAKYWASLTGTVRNTAGEVRPVTITVDRAPGQDAALSISLGDAPEVDIKLR